MRPGMWHPCQGESWCSKVAASRCFPGNRNAQLWVAQRRLCAMTENSKELVSLGMLLESILDGIPLTILGTPQCTVGRHRLGPEHVQNSTPETWSHPNTMRASAARALGGMFCNARVTYTAKLCTKNIGAKKATVLGQKKLCWKCWGKNVCAGHASHTLAHCFQEMSTCIIADRWIDSRSNRHTDRQE